MVLPMTHFGDLGRQDGLLKLVRSDYVSVSVTYAICQSRALALTIISVVRIDSVLDMHQSGAVQIHIAKDTVVGVSEILEGIDLDGHGTKTQVAGVHTSFSASIAMWLNLFGTDNIPVPIFVY